MDFRQKNQNGNAISTDGFPTPNPVAAHREATASSHSKYSRPLTTLPTTFQGKLLTTCTMQVLGALERKRDKIVEDTKFGVITPDYHL